MHTIFSNLLFQKSVPPVYCNSFQKAGTHLLVNIINEFSGRSYCGAKIYDHWLTRDLKYSKGTNCDSFSSYWSDRNYKGNIIRGHCDYTLAKAQSLSQNNVLSILIVRNPLKMTLSLMNWWEFHKEIDTKSYLGFKSLKDTGQKESALLFGSNDHIYPIKGVLDRLQMYEGWLDYKNILIVKYEDLVENPTKEVQNIHRYLYQNSLPKDRLEIVLKRGFDRTKSRTGQIPKTYHALSDELEEKYLDLKDNWSIIGRLGY